MPHRYWHLPIAALQALNASERRALEVVLKRSRYRVRLLRRQEAQLELLLVVDEVARPLPDGFGYFRVVFHAAYYTKSQSTFSA